MLDNFYFLKELELIKLWFEIKVSWYIFVYKAICFQLHSSQIYKMLSTILSIQESAWEDIYAFSLFVFFFKESRVGLFHWACTEYILWLFKYTQKIKMYWLDCNFLTNSVLKWVCCKIEKSVRRTIDTLSCY